MARVPSLQLRLNLRNPPRMKRIRLALHQHKLPVPLLLVFNSSPQHQLQRLRRQQRLLLQQTHRPRPNHNSHPPLGYSIHSSSLPQTWGISFPNLLLLKRPLLRRTFLSAVHRRNLSPHRRNLRVVASQQSLLNPLLQLFHLVVLPCNLQTLLPIHPRILCSLNLYPHLQLPPPK